MKDSTAEAIDRKLGNLIVELKDLNKNLETLKSLPNFIKQMRLEDGD